MFLYLYLLVFKFLLSFSWSKFSLFHEILQSLGYREIRNGCDLGELMH